MKLVAWILAGLVAMPHTSWAQGDIAWADLHDVPLLSVVQLTLANGRTVRGQIRRVDADMVVLTLRGSTTTSGAPWSGPGVQMTSRDRRFDRADVTAVRIAEIARSYRADGTPDPKKVGRVVRALGVGGVVTLRMVGAGRMKARIRAIDDSGFTVQRGRELQRIAFEDVEELKSGMAGWAKAALIAGISVGALIGIWGWIYATCNCS